jgi:ParB family transcriptional regulator, chromosome partitioning protein
LNVRQTEGLVAHLQNSSPRHHANSRSAGKGAGPARDAHLSDLENKLRERFGTRVSLRYRQGKGAVEIRFFNDDDLARILQVAGVNVD